MAASSLKESLQALHKSLAGAASQKESAIGIVTDLNQICVQELTDKDIGWRHSLIFNIKKSISWQILSAIQMIILDV